MTDLPGAKQTIDPTAGAMASGRDVITVFGAVPQHADMKPRLFGSASALYSYHGFSDSVVYASLHIEATKKPINFVGFPIDVAGVIGQLNTSGNSGSSTVGLVAGSDGVLGEHRGSLVVEAGGTIGTDQILLRLSLDGGRTSKKIRLGTANSLALPFVGATFSFGAGTLATGDTIATWIGTGPRAASGDFAAARAELAKGQQGFRSILLIGDVQNASEANAMATQAAAYASENDRFIYTRVQIPSHVPLAVMGSESRRMLGGPALTFATADDSITRASGSYLAEGFAVNDAIEITGSEDNDTSTFADSVAADALGVVSNLVDESLGSGLGAIVASTGLLFSNTGTIVRSRGSWLDDGFRVGKPATVAGTAGGTNDFSGVAPTVVTALSLTFPSGTIDADERIAAVDVDVTSGQAKAAWMAAQTTAFATVDGNSRIDLGAGRAYKLDSFTNWEGLRPVAWAASIREFSQSPHLPTWEKDLGPLQGWSLLEPDNSLEQWDDRVDGKAASAARFTSFRSWANGPGGAFIAVSLTRATEGSLTGLTHHQAVVDIGMTITQVATENVVGRVLQKQENGRATEESLKAVEGYVQGQLESGLLQDRGGGTRLASGAMWVASREDLFNVPEPVLHGVLTITLNGVVFSVDTAVKIQ